ncbi:sugar MFS transporter [Paucibacter soli]|uniref:sugar MFS transporter n=1 Tax=Paucibacter soli TaxID=3133433 RepID=UPI00309A1ACE
MRASQASPGAASLQSAVTALFFLWGGITSLNDVLLPKLKSVFVLSYAEAMLVQFAFFAAYALVSVPAGRLLARLGFGRGIVIGLVVMALGCLLFLPAAVYAVYAVFLLALFVLAAGITILQVAANPLIAGLGSAASSHSRLTLAQAFNSLGTTLLPLLGAQLLLGGEHDAGGAAATQLIGRSYLGIATLLLLMAVGFWWVRGRLASSLMAEPMLGGASWRLLARPRLGLGVLAMFLYVGAEVAIGSLLVNFLMQPDTLALDERRAGSAIALYWGGAMLGRFAGAALLRRIAPGVALAAVALGAGALALVAAFASGPPAAWALLSIGLMNAIMFPTIFSLAVEGLGARVAQGSGLLCMAIVGGAIVPVAVGALADAAGLAASLLIPALCYGGIAAYGLLARPMPAPPGLAADAGAGAS